MKRSALLLLIVVAPFAVGGSLWTPTPAFWGRHGHGVVGAAAVRALPAEMPAFFRDAGQQLAYLNYEPDRWRDNTEFRLDRALGSAYSPEHYIDFEGVPTTVFEAHNRYAFIEQLRETDLEDPNIGFLPWRTLELAQLLRSNFRRWREATDPDTRRWIEERIINDAGILGHYVADGSNPHHTSIHHNGWVGDNPSGYPTDRDTHSRFESAYVEAQIGLEDVLPYVTEELRVVRDFRHGILEYLRESHEHLIPLYELDKKQRFGPDVTSAEHRAFASARLGTAASMLRDLWWSAWVTSAEGS